MSARPFFYVPSSAEPGQLFAFGDRDGLVQELFRAVAHAGRALREGSLAVRHRRAVVGYEGVGKSALILRALEMVRDAEPGGLVKDPERWLIFRFSGKHYSSFEALTDGLVSLSIEEETNRSSAPDELLLLARDFALQAEGSVPQETFLSIVHKRFSQEQRLYAGVREALHAMTSAITYVQTWRGATLSRQEERTVQADLSRTSEAALEAEIKSLIAVPETAEGKAGLRIAAGILKKHASALRGVERIEGRWRVSSEILVDVLNHFLDQCTRARLPTILVLDDFDEFASASGSSHRARSEVLSHVLGPLHLLRPTVFLLGLRKEYMDWDVRRNFEVTEVPPATPPEALEMVRAWAGAQTPKIEGEALVDLVALAQSVLGVLRSDEPGVVPFRFLRLLAWLYNAGQDPSRRAEEMLSTFLDRNHDYFARVALRKVAELMPEPDVLRCMTTSPLSPDPYQLSEAEAGALRQDGLLRPAVAGDQGSREIILDPMAAWLRRSLSR